ncbi:MAG: electron transport complex subunit RsxC [Clostridia bacterium]|nr:electron transport complex subunit RsxC [Clostridia bacterium]
MKKFTFSGGIHPPGKKEYTENKPLVKLDAPELLYFPLGQHIGAPLKPIVSVGDTVLRGGRIADSEAFMAAPLHSSVSGKVKDIGLYLNSSNTRVPTIVIENDGEDKWAEPITTKNPDDLTPKEMLQIIREAGIVGMGGAGFPTHVKLSPPEDKKITHLIVNAAECEPYLTSDRRVMLEMTDDVFGGLGYLMRLLNLSECYIGIEDNAKEAIKVLKEKAMNYSGINVIELKQKYPQGSEKQIINAITGKEVPTGKLPMDVGCIVINIGTVAEIYRAIHDGIALHRRIVTVSGDAIANPTNLYARIGTPLRNLTDAAGGFKEEPHKIILGGPMMGIAGASLDIPVTKGTSGLLAFTEKYAHTAKESPCIRCGRCVSVCPMKLMPTTLDMYSRRNDIDVLIKNNILSCMECGSCTYVCPSKRYLVQSIRMGKQKIAARRTKEKKEGAR